jgi:hypothetical protein
MKIIVRLVFLLFTIPVLAQTDSSKTVEITGYAEVYYLYDFGNPSSHNRPDFVYSHNRHNEVNINLGFIKASYENTRTRANLALGVGTYMNANLAAEPGVLKNVYEANVGVKLSKQNELWLDAGVFSSHIGFESAIGKDNWTLTRSMFADNSPYYESGAKLSYTTKNNKWLLSVLLLNGWQRIQRLPANNSVAVGHQLQYKPNKKVMLNSSSFIGNDKPDSTKQMRYFHNFYGLFQLTTKASLALGFDMGIEQSQKGSATYNKWFTPVGILKYQLKPTHSIALRAEYYSDKNNVIVYTNNLTGFEVYSASINYDYKVTSQVMWRTEARAFKAKQKVFMMDDAPSTQNYVLATSLTFSF